MINSNKPRIRIKLPCITISTECAAPANREIKNEYLKCLIYPKVSKKETNKKEQMGQVKNRVRQKLQSPQNQ